ncbi:MAG: NUDIX domain-containing protein, partial [Thermodesulfobacteriaceae bacterium]|nr:NUDIX domain-containing protein [Thermodesulfobacteriaceae bacterium]
VRNCAGGVVFCGEKVFLLKNEKGEWVLPKGVIRNGDYSNEVALRRVKEEALEHTWEMRIKKLIDKIENLKNSR